MGTRLGKAKTADQLDAATSATGSDTMSLDTHSAPTPDDLIQYGKDEAVRLMTELAQKEAQGGDGRAMRMLMRLVEAAGLRGRKVRPVQDDDGA